jgi:hypothetical protein
MQLESDYNVSRMEPAVTGGEDANICGGCPYDARPDSASTVCQDCTHNPTGEDSESRQLGSAAVDPDNTVANPDNVFALDDGRLLIGEDTPHHVNNMIWVYNPGVVADTDDDGGVSTMVQATPTVSPAEKVTPSRTETTAPGLSPIIGGVGLGLGVLYRLYTRDE